MTLAGRHREDRLVDRAERPSRRGSCPGPRTRPRWSARPARRRGDPGRRRPHSCAHGACTSTAPRPRGDRAGCPGCWGRDTRRSRSRARTARPAPHPRSRRSVRSPASAGPPPGRSRCRRSGRMTANSSPPTRNARSPRRMALVVIRPSPARSSSPFAWPRSSFTFLRSSTSTSSRASVVPCRVALLQLAAELLLERAVVPEVGQRVDERVLARPAVQIDEPGPLGLETLHVAEDRLGEPGHHDGDDDRAEGQKDDRQPATRAAGPEALDGGHAHEQDEDGREDPDESAADVERCAGVERRVMFGVVIGHALPTYGIRLDGCTSRRCRAAPRPKYRRDRPLGPRTRARA